MPELRFSKEEERRTEDGMSNPTHEIWGYDVSDGEDAPARFREDCYSLMDAKDARAEWQLNGRAAWIVNKETGEIVKAVAHIRGRNC